MTIQDKIKRLVGIIVFANMVIVVGYLKLLGCPENVWNLFKYNATLAMISIGIFLLVNYYLWHIPGINILFGSMPNINGEWKSKIINSKDEEVQQATLKVKQTWFNTHVVTIVDRANSSTISSEVIKVNDTWKLYFTWSASLEGIPFTGTTIVQIHDDRLDGYYFTNSNFDGRKCTSGTFFAEKLVKKQG